MPSTGLSSQQVLLAASRAMPGSAASLRAVCAAYPSHAQVIRDVFEGRCATPALPAQVARATVAAGPPGGVDLTGEVRRTVLEAAGVPVAPRPARARDVFEDRDSALEWIANRKRVFPSHVSKVLDLARSLDSSDAAALIRDVFEKVSKASRVAIWDALMNDPTLPRPVELLDGVPRRGGRSGVYRGTLVAAAKRPGRFCGARDDADAPWARCAEALAVFAHMMAPPLPRKYHAAFASTVSGTDVVVRAAQWLVISRASDEVVAPLMAQCSTHEEFMAASWSDSAALCAAALRRWLEEGGAQDPPPFYAVERVLCTAAPVVGTAVFTATLVRAAELEAPHMRLAFLWPFAARAARFGFTTSDVAELLERLESDPVTRELLHKAVTAPSPEQSGFPWSGAKDPSTPALSVLWKRRCELTSPAETLAAARGSQAAYTGAAGAAFEAAQRRGADVDPVLLCELLPEWAGSVVELVDSLEVCAPTRSAA